MIDEHETWLRKRGFVPRWPWPVAHNLRYRWQWRPAAPPWRLHLRTGPRRRYTTHSPLAYRWNRWQLVRIEHGTGGPYSADWYFWRREFAGGRRPVETKVYCVEW